MFALAALAADVCFGCNCSAFWLLMFALISSFGENIFLGCRRLPRTPVIQKIEG